MRIAVISDTYDRLPSSVLEELQAADEIWHLGDVTAEETLGRLKLLRKPLYVIRGNRDHQIYWPWVITFRREGYTIRLVHLPPKEAPEGVDLVFHGHSHVPRREKVGATEFFNPGTIGKANHEAPPSWAWLTLEAGSPIGWELVLV